MLYALALSEYCEDKYGVSTEKLKRDLTSKCDEESIRLLKQQLVIVYVYIYIYIIILAIFILRSIYPRCINYAYVRTCVLYVLPNSILLIRISTYVSVLHVTCMLVACYMHVICMFVTW